MGTYYMIKWELHLSRETEWTVQQVMLGKQSPYMEKNEMQSPTKCHTQRMLELVSYRIKAN